MSRCRFVHDQRDTYRVKRLCRMVEVSRSGYYRWAGAVPSARAVADGELVEEIRRIHLESRCTYGAPRVHGQAHVAPAASRCGLPSAPRPASGERPFAASCVGGATMSRIAPAPDRLGRDFTARRPNQRWVADITEFSTGEGELHLAGCGI